MTTSSSVSSTTRRKRRDRAAAAAATATEEKTRTGTRSQTRRKTRRRGEPRLPDSSAGEGRGGAGSRFVVADGVPEGAKVVVADSTYSFPLVLSAANASPWSHSRFFYAHLFPFVRSRCDDDSSVGDRLREGRTNPITTTLLQIHIIMLQYSTYVKHFFQRCPLTAKTEEIPPSQCAIAIEKEIFSLTALRVLSYPYYSICMLHTPLPSLPHVVAKSELATST